MSFWKTIQKQNSFLFGYESLMFLAQRNYWHPPLFLPYYSQILTLVFYSQICKLPHLLAFLALNSLLCTMLNSQVNLPKRSMVATQFHIPVNVQYFHTVEWSLTEVQTPDLFKAFWNLDQSKYSDFKIEKQVSWGKTRLRIPFEKELKIDEEDIGYQKARAKLYTRYDRNSMCVYRKLLLKDWREVE